MIISSREERRNADGQENRQADKSGSSTYTTCLRNRNSDSSYQNDYWEYPIGSGEVKLPYLKNNIVCLQNQYDKKYFETCGSGCLVACCGSWSDFTVYMKYSYQRKSVCQSKN